MSICLYVNEEPPKKYHYIQYFVVSVSAVNTYQFWFKSDKSNKHMQTTSFSMGILIIMCYLMQQGVF